MSAAVSILVTAEYAGECWSCGVPIWVPANRYRKLRENPEQTFYCCNGHCASFKTTETDRLKEENKTLQLAVTAAREMQEREMQRRRTAERGAAIARGKLKATKERIGNGICPCCHRSFEDLRRHMQSKHPGYAEDGRPPAPPFKPLPLGPKSH